MTRKNKLDTITPRTRGHWFYQNRTNTRGKTKCQSWINIFTIYQISCQNYSYTTTYIGGRIKSSPGLNIKGWIKFHRQLRPSSCAQTSLAVFFSYFTFEFSQWSEKMCLWILVNSTPFHIIFIYSKVFFQTYFSLKFHNV